MNSKISFRNNIKGLRNLDSWEQSCLYLDTDIFEFYKKISTLTIKELLMLRLTTISRYQGCIQVELENRKKDNSDKPDN